MRALTKILSLVLITGFAQAAEVANQEAHRVDPRSDFIKSSIRTIPDFPKPGIQFRDITSMLSNPPAFQASLDVLTERYLSMNVDAFAGFDARGFIFATALADRLKKPLVLIRKPGKLPGEKFSVSYGKEYGKDVLEMHKGDIEKGWKVVLCDDLLATGGTANAGVDLVQQAGGSVVELAVVVDLPELKGRSNVKVPVFSIVSFEGE